MSVLCRMIHAECYAGCCVGRSVVFWGVVGSSEVL